jgi:transcriptional regulator with XRE-family HTH domain
MENETGMRIKDLRQYYRLSVKEFAAKSGLSHVAIFHLEKGRTSKPHRSSLKRIASAFGTTVEWILYGQDEMLPLGKKALEIDDASFWKNEAVLELKSKNQFLEREVERLWKIVQALSNQPKSELARMLDAG